MSEESPPGSTTAELRGKTELRDFLRSRRARLTPEAAGLAPHPGDAGCQASGGRKSRNWPG